jgi:hypothetical protein
MVMLVDTFHLIRNRLNQPIHLNLLVLPIIVELVNAMVHPTHVVTTAMTAVVAVTLVHVLYIVLEIVVDAIQSSTALVICLVHRVFVAEMHTIVGVVVTMVCVQRKLPVSSRNGVCARDLVVPMIVAAIPMTAMKVVKMVFVPQNILVVANLVKEMVSWVIVVIHPRIVLLRVKQANVVTPNSHVLHP